jgi:hypothetical protein
MRLPSGSKRSASSLGVDQPSKALHEASSSRHAKQDGPVNLFSGRKLCEAVGDGLRRDHHGDGSPVRVASFFVWHARGMPEDGRSDVEDASTDVGFLYKCGSLSWRRCCASIILNS